MVEIEYILARKIRELANLLTKSRDADIRDLDLTTAQADAMFYFAENQGKSAVDLKNFLGVTHQTARGIVDRMVAKGLLTTVPSPKDARYKQVFLTEKGTDTWQRMRENGTTTGHTLLNGMNAEDKVLFLSMITLALNNLDANNTQSQEEESLT